LTFAGTEWMHLVKTASHWTILRMNYYAESMAEEIQLPLHGTRVRTVADTDDDVFFAAE
jgi:hypothetical protein